MLSTPGQLRVPRTREVWPSWCGTIGTALVLLRSAPPIVTDLGPWTARPDAKELRLERSDIEACLRRR
jgi:hypothetical protein